MCLANHASLRFICRHVACFAVVAFATVTQAVADELNTARNPASTPAPMVGVATGESVNGLPVYRLPPIHVAADRKTELARIAKEDAIARANRASAAATKRATQSAPVTLAAHRATK